MVIELDSENWFVIGMVDILFLSMAGLQHEYFEFYGDICLEKSNPGLSSVLVEI